MEMIERAADIIVQKQGEPGTAPYHWAGALFEAGMLTGPGGGPGMLHEMYALLCNSRAFDAAFQAEWEQAFVKLRDRYHATLPTTQAKPERQNTDDGWRPTVREGEALEDVPLSRWIGEAIGAASMCWMGGPIGEFDPAEAKRIVDALEGKIVERIYQEQEANIGLATTRQLLEELQVRGDMNAVGAAGTKQGVKGALLADMASVLLRVLSKRDLGYSTVEGWPSPPTPPQGPQ